MTLYSLHLKLPTGVNASTLESISTVSSLSGFLARRIALCHCDEDIDKLVELCGKNLFDKAMTLVDSMLKDGFPALQILTQLAETVVVSPSCGDAVKARVALRVAEADKALTDGADESLQLGAVVSVSCLALGGK